MINSTPRPPRKGSAIAMVGIFLLFVAIIAFGVSFQGQFTRTFIGRSHHGYELVELCDSAINEAGGRLDVLKDLFPDALFGPARFKSWLVAMATEDEPAMNAALPGGFTFKFGDLVDASTLAPKEKIFLYMKWPKDFKVEYDVPQTAALAAKLPGFKGPLGKVTARVVMLRRDFVGGMWQDWGVVQFKVSATLEDNGHLLTRTMYADRMFALTVDFDPAGLGGMPPTISDLYINAVRSDRNLRTVIERS